MQAKSSISPQKVQALVDEGYRQADIAKIFGVTQSYISRITKKVSVQKQEKKKICSCCGRRPVADGNRFLCYNCARLPESDFEEFSVAL
jgi:transcriptional regulator with XRE-family HTH domain